MKIKRLLSLILVLSLALGSLLPIFGSVSYAEEGEGVYLSEEELEVLPPNFEGKILTDDELIN